MFLREVVEWICEGDEGYYVVGKSRRYELVGIIYENRSGC